MGKVEAGAKEKRRKDYIQRAVLSAVGIAGVLAITAVAPNALRVLGMLGMNRRFKYQTQSVLSRLAAKGHVRFIEQGEKKRVEITPAGQRALDLQVQTARVRTKRPKRWDRRWRIIMFDICEERKKDRDHLRRIMIESGFHCFQDSVWIFPYDCEELVTLLKIDMHLGNAVRYAIVEKLENDKEVRVHFKLP